MPISIPKQGNGLKSGLTLVFLSLLLACNATQSTSAAPVASSATIPVEGASLYLETRAASASAPVLLWLHGGPGGAERPLFRHFNAELEQDFVVAYLDQRGAGRSFDADAQTSSLTISQHLADLDIVIRHLQDKFGQQKIILLGHSWGATLGLLYASEHPENIAAMVGVNPLISSARAQEARFSFVREAALEAGDSKSLTILDNIGTPPHNSASEAMQVERLTDRYGGIFHQRPNMPWVMLAGVFKGLVNPFEIPRFIRANNISLEAMHQELMAVDLADSLPALEVPVHFFLGRHDRHVEANIAADYLAALQAPRKQLLWFEASAHNIPFEEPQAFHAAVRALIP